MEQRIFTEHLLRLRDGEDPGDEAYKLMSNILRKKLRQEGLYSRTPRLLGISGESWQDEEVFAELLHDCYVFSICDRVRGLFVQLDLKPNVEGLVCGNIYRFISAARRRADPRGYVVGQALKQVVKRLIEEGSVIGTADAKLSTDFMVRTDPSQPTMDGNEIRELILGDGKWVEILPQLHSSSVEAELCDKVKELLGRGGFRFGDAVWTIRSIAEETSPVDVNPAYHTDWGAAQKGFQEDIRTVLPDVSYDNKEAVASAIENLIQMVRSLSGRARKVRERMERLLMLIRSKIESGELDERSSQADFARELGVGTSTLAEDIKQIRILFETENGGDL